MPTKLSVTGRLNARAALRMSVSATAVAAALLGPAPAQAADRWSTNCVGSRGLFSCVDQWGPGGSIVQVITVPAVRDDREAAASAERERLWVARCRPVSRLDDHGVRRFSYAAPGCEFGKYED
jgi:hypothetical protein